MTSALRNTSLSLALLALTACGGGESVDEQITRAGQAMAKGEYQAAMIDLKNALKEDGESAQARWLLGKLYLEGGDVLSAEKELRRARQLGWDANDVRPALAEALLAQSKFADISELSSNGLDSHAQARLLSSKAIAELAQGNQEKANDSITQALELEPDLVEAKLAEARIQASQGDFTGALIILQEIVIQAPDYGPAWSLQGDILMREQQLPEALEAFSKAIEFSKNSFSDRLKRALIELQVGDFEAAQADADVLLRSAPQHPASNYIQGLLHFRNQSYSEAVTSLSVAEPVAQQFPMIMFYLGSSQLIEGNQDQAAVAAARFHALAPDHAPGRKLLATIRLQQGRFDEVTELVQPVLDNNPNDIGALNLMANALLREGETDSALDMLAKIAELQPDSPAAQVRLGAGLLLTGQEDAATEHMETALELNPEFQQADILLVLNHVKAGDIEAATKAAKAYRRRNPGKIAPHNLLGRVYLAGGQEDEARESFEKALTLDPGDPAANSNLAQLAIAAGNLPEARKHYMSTLEHHPDSMQTLIQLAFLEAQDQNEEGMVGYLREAMEKNPSALQPRLLLGRYYLRKGNAEQVAPLFSTLTEAQQKSPEVLQLMASAQLQGRQISEAQFTLEQLLEESPNTPSTHHMMAMAAAGNGDTDRAKEELQRAVELDENYLPSLAALARVAAVEQDNAAFDSYLARLTELAPDAPEVLRLRAAAARRNGNLEQALEFSSQAFAAAPATQTMLEYVAYQKLAGDDASATKTQQQWLADNPQDVSARIALANELQFKGEDSAAVEQYKAVIELAPDNLIALNNLAWFLREKNPEQALEYIRRAAEIAPERPEVLDTLAVIEHLQGENRKARRNIERALTYAPGNPSMMYHKAQILAELDDSSGAREILKRILIEGGPDFPEKAEAKALLQRL